MPSEKSQAKHENAVTSIPFDEVAVVVEDAMDGLFYKLKCLSSRTTRFNKKLEVFCSPS